MEKQDTVYIYIYTIEYYLEIKNKEIYQLQQQVEPEIIVLSELSHTEKNTYHMIWLMPES